MPIIGDPFYSGSWRVDTEYINLVPKAQYIIIATSGAANPPIQHATKELAEKEAERLARKFPNDTFTIYKTVKSYKAEEKPLTVKEYV